MGFLERMGLGAPSPEDRARLQRAIDANHAAEARLDQSMRRRDYAVGKLELLPEYSERTRLEIALQLAETKLSAARRRVTHLNEMRRLRLQMATMKGEAAPVLNQEDAAASSTLAVEQAAYDKVKVELDTLNTDIARKEDELRRQSGL